MRRSSLLALFAISLSGCASTQPERVYVDLDRVMATLPASVVSTAAVPNPPPGAPPVIVKQPGLSATSTTDRILARLKDAKKLIEENRHTSIQALSNMLERIYVAQAQDTISKREHAARDDQDAVLSAALDRLSALFVAYGEERGPPLAQLNVLAGNTILADQPVPDGADELTKLTITKSNALRAQIRNLDSRYDAEASQLMGEAENQIQAEIDRLQKQADTEVAAARVKAHQEAESKATATQASLDVQVQRLVPEKLAAVPARQVVVAGTPALPAAPSYAAPPIFGSLEQRRLLANEEIDVWIRSTGRARAASSRTGRDVTDEFLKWKSAHKVGP